MNAINRKGFNIRSAGFTMLEILISLVIMGAVMGGLATTYVSQQRSSAKVGEVSQMQQQLRGAFYIIERSIRVAGLDDDSGDSTLRGVEDIRRWTISDDETAPTLDANGSPSLSVTADADRDGSIEWFTFRLYDDGGDGEIDLARDLPGGTRQLVAEGIEAIGFAYAYDDDDDGELDRTAGGNIIWAIDSDNNNLLDTNLDTDDNGVIDINDAGEDGWITDTDGSAGPLPVEVALSKIRMIRVWLLARASVADNKYSNNEEYVVGNQVVNFDSQDGFRRRLMVRALKCRNLGTNQEADLP